MRQQVPAWVAVVVILIALLVVAGIYIRWGRPAPQEPQAPFLKGQPVGPEAPPGQRPVMEPPVKQR